MYDFIDYLSMNSNTDLALCTSALYDEIETILGSDGLGIRDRFAYIVSGADVKRSKPDPEIYSKLAAISGIVPRPLSSKTRQ